MLGLRLFLRLAIALLGILALSLPALAREEISAFNSATVLAADGSVDVTETIDVNAEGDRIRHGIFRDVFTVLRNDDGSKVYSGLSVLDVERDGHAEPYTTEGIDNGERIRIGDADTVIDPGPHRYVIHYTMTRMARFFADHDELFWNATGNFWDFPIVKATATITLPPGAVISDLVAYTGPEGSQEHAATLTRTGDTTATFRATRELAPGEGMSVAAAFQKGVVVAAAGPANWLSDHRDTVAPALAVLVVLLYNLFAWNNVGRDPRKGTIIPLFHPPEGLSPATAQWVSRMGFKGPGWVALTAGLFDLGVKKLVTVDNRDKVLTVTGTGNRPDAPLPADERVLYDYFGGHNTRVLDKGTGQTLNSKRIDMLGAITKPNKGTWFNLNIGYVVVGVVIAVACLVGLVGVGVLDPGLLIAALVIGGILGIVTAFVRGGGGRSPFGLIFAGIWVLVFGANAIGALIGLAGNSLLDTPAIAAASIVVITIAFGFLMRAPTLAGRRLMDQIDGFRMYLETAEKNRLNLDGEPPLTVSRFEAILPFAIALGVEQPWSDKFNAALAANAVPDATGTGYVPLWYTGNSFTSTNVASSIAAISTGMSAAMAAAVPSSSSSSGFSGGGGSGGGGGGGGGGGW